MDNDAVPVLAALHWVCLVEILDLSPTPCRKRTGQRRIAPKANAVTAFRRTKGKSRRNKAATLATPATEKGTFAGQRMESVGECRTYCRLDFKRLLHPLAMPTPGLGRKGKTHVLTRLIELLPTGNGRFVIFIHKEHREHQKAFGSKARYYIGRNVGLSAQVYRGHLICLS